MNKLIARTGFASRRKADVLIERGRVTVNGEVATMGVRIDPVTDLVAIDGVPIPLDPELVTWLLYKPPGVVSTMNDPQGRPTVKELVPADPPTNPVGRLDLHSEGLMFMTNDGDFALRVTHPRYGIEKVYQALVPIRVSKAAIAELIEGVELDDGIAKARRARIVTSSNDRTLIEIVMTEGRKREVRRMLDAVGCRVQGLVRVSIASIADRSLSPGDYRALTADEIRGIYALSEKAVSRD